MDSTTKIINENNHEAEYLLPNISDFRATIERKFHEYEYNFMTYQLFLGLFKNIIYDQRMDLESFIKKYILQSPFISFNDDIFEPATDKNKTIQNKMMNIYNYSQKSGIKGILLFGERGIGKGLVVHALAKQIDGVLIKIEDARIFRIPYFALELRKICLEFTKKPVVIFIKNIDLIVMTAFSSLLYLYDKFNNNNKNIVFIVSYSILTENLPK